MASDAQRCRYDWSEPGTVKATVIDSNVLEPGSTWELRVAPQRGGSKVQMTVERRFRRGLAGRTAHALNRLGRWGVAPRSILVAR